MARQYSPKSFLRQAPNKLIRRYLEDRNVGNDIKWDALRELLSAELKYARAARPISTCLFRAIQARTPVKTHD
jgi:hypothetical protein